MRYYYIVNIIYSLYNVLCGERVHALLEIIPRHPRLLHKPSVLVLFEDHLTETEEAVVVLAHSTQRTAHSAQRTVQSAQHTVMSVSLFSLFSPQA